MSQPRGGWGLTDRVAARLKPQLIDNACVCTCGEGETKC